MELGAYVREVRKRQGWTLENLADEHISISTISNEELGKTNVKPEKIAYLLTKLKVQLEELPKLMNQQSELQTDTTEWIKEQLLAIEHLIDLEEEAKGWSRLKALLKAEELETHHPLIALVNYIKGKYYFNKPERDKARNCFL
jgi:transcriptional regulator with XRE-family HTH domain